MAKTHVTADCDRRICKFVVQMRKQCEPLENVQVRFWTSGEWVVAGSGAPNENVVQNHLKIALLNVF